jgi:hypothetical protein
MKKLTSLILIGIFLISSLGVKAINVEKNQIPELGILNEIIAIDVSSLMIGGYS